MNRKTVEKEILKRLLSKIEGYSLAKEDYSSKFNHLGILVKSVDDLKYVVNLRFMRPNYLKLQVQFMVFSNKVNEALKDYLTFYNEFGLPIMNFDLEDYFSHINPQNQRDFYIDDDSGLEAIKTEDVAHRIYIRYFSLLESDFINRLRTLKDISHLINNEATFIDGKLKPSVFCFPEQFQILGGAFSALFGKDKDCQSTIKKYWDYSLAEYQEGEDNFIEGFWNYMRVHEQNLL